MKTLHYSFDYMIIMEVFECYNTTVRIGYCYFTYTITKPYAYNRLKASKSIKSIRK